MNALSHPTRRAILERLMSGEERITEVAAPFDMSLNAVSKHIAVLERAGLVRRRRVWREHRVSFNPEPLDEVSSWIEDRRAFWSEQLRALDALLQAQSAPSARSEQPYSTRHRPCSDGGSGRRKVSTE